MEQVDCIAACPSSRPSIQRRSKAATREISSTLAALLELIIVQEAEHFARTLSDIVAGLAHVDFAGFATVDFLAQAPIDA